MTPSGGAIRTPGSDSWRIVLNRVIRTTPLRVRMNRVIRPIGADLLSPSPGFRG